MNVLRAIRGFLATAMLSCVFVAVHADTARADWTQTNGPKGGSVRSFVTVPNGAGVTRLFAGQQGVWVTDDNGASWVHHDDGLTDPNAFSLLAVPNGSGGNDLLMGTNGGIFRSTDNGVSWNASNSGLTNLSIYSLASGPNGSGGTNLYAGACPVLWLSQLTNFAASNQLTRVAGLSGPRESLVIPSPPKAFALSIICSEISCVPIR